MQYGCIINDRKNSMYINTIIPIRYVPCMPRVTLTITSLCGCTIDSYHCGLHIDASFTMGYIRYIGYIHTDN